MDEGARVSLRSDVLVQLRMDGQIGVWDATTAQYLPIPPEALYLLALLSQGRSLGGALERAGFELDDSIRTFLGGLAKKRIIGEAGPEGHATAAASAPGSGDPIFVLGSHRSGTTLVRWVLDTHPRISCVADTLFLGGLKQSIFSAQPALVRLRSLGVSEELLRKTVHELVESVYSTMLRQSGKARWADKTNAYSEIADFLAWLFDGRCRFVVVVRHGLDVASSDFHEQRSGSWAQEDGQEGGYPLDARLRKWARLNEYLHRFVTRNRAICFPLRYEDFVADPEARGRELFAFLGEEMPPDLLARAFEHDHDPEKTGPVFEDYKIRNTMKIESDRADRWRSWPKELVASVADIANPVLALWGYDRV